MFAVWHDTYTASLARPPAVGDIVIFHPREGAVAKPEWYEDDVFIKRIVAVAGDTVEARLPPFTLQASVQAPSI